MLVCSVTSIFMQYFQHDDWIEKHKIAVFLLAAQITDFVLEHCCSTCYISAISISPITFVINLLFVNENWHI